MRPLLLPAAALGALLVLAGCAPTLSPVDRQALDRAGHEVAERLTPAGQLAATAVLIREDTGAFPATRFALLGSPQADATGARRLPLAAIDVERDGDALVIRYIPLPTLEDPTDRLGTVTIRPRGEDGLYAAAVELVRRVDADHTGRPIPLAREGVFEVWRLASTFAIDAAVVRARAAVGEVGALPLHDEPYRIVFRPMVPEPGVIPPERAEGYAVTIGR